MHETVLVVEELLALQRRHDSAHERSCRVFVILVDKRLVAHDEVNIRAERRSPAIGSQDLALEQRVGLAKSRLQRIVERLHLASGNEPLDVLEMGQVSVLLFVEREVHVRQSDEDRSCERAPTRSSFAEPTVRDPSVTSRQQQQKRRLEKLPHYMRGKRISTARSRRRSSGGGTRPRQKGELT